MARKYLIVNDTPWPTPSEITITRNAIWSEDTGRSADNTMQGTKTGSKTKLAITWPNLTPAQAQSLSDAIEASQFVTIRYPELSGLDATKEFYFGDPNFTLDSWTTDGRRVSGITVDAIER